MSIYPRPAERGRNARFMVADYCSGRRKWRTFSDLKAAKAEATRIANLLRVGDVDGATMTGDERRDLLRRSGSTSRLPARC